MINLTTNQIIQIARKKILETTNELVDEITILIYLNLTQDDVVLRAFPASTIKSATIGFTGGIGVLPTDFGTLYGDPFVTDSEIYPTQSIQDFTRGNRGIVVEGGVIKIFPADIPLVYIKYFPSFPELTTIVNPTLPAPLQEALIYGTVYRALEDMQDFETAAYFENKYNKLVEQKLSNLSQYEETGQTGGQFFNPIQII